MRNVANDHNVEMPFVHSLDSQEVFTELLPCAVGGNVFNCLARNLFP